VTFRIFEGDTIPDVSLTVRNRATGLPRDLSAATVETVAMVNGQRFTGTVTPVALASGQVTLSWPAITTSGTGQVMCRVTDGDDVQTVYAEAVRVRPTGFEASR
jgi:hypothetical protein